MTLLEGIVAGTVTTATLSLDSGYGLTSEERMLLFGTRQVIVPQTDSELRKSVIPSVPIPPPDTPPDETLQRYRRSSLGRRRGSGVVLPNPDVVVDGLSGLTSDEAVEDLPTAVSVDITEEVASLSAPTPVPAPSASEMKRAAVTRYLCMKRSQFIQEEILSWK